MKRLLHTVLLNLLTLLFSFSYMQGQTLTVEGFENSLNFTADYPGWNTGLPPFSVIQQNACEGNNALRINLFNGNLLSFVEYTAQSPSTGNDVVISFDYKIVDKATGNLATGDFGQIDLLYSIDGGATWFVYDIIAPSDLPTADCSLHTYSIPAATAPAGSIVAWKLDASFSANYSNQNDGVYLYVDDFRMVEQVPCIQPVKLDVDESTIDYDGATISWVDLNTSSPSWEIAYCTTLGSPGAGNPLCFPKTAGALTPIPATQTNYTFNSLNNGTKYYVYVRTACGTNGNSLWSGPIIFQTIAVGTDCSVPIEVNANPTTPAAGDLPYTHVSETNLYGSNEYFGSPGNTCGGTASLLNGYEVVYQYVSFGDDILSIDVTGLTGMNVGVFVYDECADIGTVCVNGAITSSGSDLNLNSLYTTAGEDYYIVIASISPAGAPENTQYTLHIEGFDCAAWVVPNGNSTLQFITGQTLDNFSGIPNYGITPTIVGATLSWYQDNNGSVGSKITAPLNSITLNDGDKYWVTQSLTIGGAPCESPAILVTFQEFDCGTQLTGITSSQGDSVCESGIMTLSATAGSQEVYWYESASGGNVLEQSNTYTTPLLFQTTSYWAAEVFVGIGLIDHQGSPGPSLVASQDIDDRGLKFTINQQITLVDVRVFVTDVGNNVTVELLDPNGNVIKGPLTIPITSGTMAVPQSNTLTLNWILSPGTYYLMRKSGPKMMVDLGNFPYPLGSAGHVTSSIEDAPFGGYNTNFATYYYFFDWTIIGPGILCESPRTEVIATVHEVIPTTVSADDLQVCVGSSTMLHVQSPNQNYTFQWRWFDINGSLQTATTADITITPLQNTTYTVTATDSTTTCEFINDISIEVYGAGSIPVEPLQVGICLSEIVELTAGGIKYDFENPNTGWTTINVSNSPNGGTASASWHLVGSPHISTGNTTSNDSSQFYISVADSLGAEGVLDTQLISPSINTVGLNSLSIDFYHHLNFIETQETVGKVEVSVNNEPWQIAETFDGGPTGNIDIGTPTQFAHETVDLSNYVGAANLRVRFHYTGGWGWWWAIDNVTFNLGYINGTITWTPTTNLYLNPQASIPYNGTVARNVYFFGNQTGTYNYTATLNVTNCGSVTENVTINVNQTPLPTGNPQQAFSTGDIVHDLVVSGQNLAWYVQDANGNFVQVSVNTPLQPGATYYVSQTMNGCESGFLAISVLLVCPAPTNVQINTTTNGATADAIVTWTPPGDVSSVLSYFVEIVETGSGTVFYDVLVPLGQDYTVIQGLGINTNYTLNIYSVCDNSVPVYSNTFSLAFQTLNVAGFGFKGFSYYPNPTRGKVFFENNKPIEQLSVYDLTGKQILRKEHFGKKAQVDLSGLPPGIYLVSLSVDGTRKIVKVIKE